MSRREELSKKLHDIIGNDNVYFQPPASVRIKYPCCIYELGRGATTRANNSIYNYVNSYQLTNQFCNAWLIQYISHIV